jgi:Protein of unknown function (DUF3253)
MTSFSDDIGVPLCIAASPAWLFEVKLLTRRPGSRRGSDMTDSPQTPKPTLDQVILALCAEQRPGHSISPIEAAQAFALAREEDALAWRTHLTAVRSAAVKLADAGRLVIYRKGKPVDPHDFRGVYRLGIPHSD